MSALTRDRATSDREGIEVEFPVAAATKIYAGSMVCVNDAGYARAGGGYQRLPLCGGGHGAGGQQLRRRWRRKGCGCVGVGVFEFDAAALTQAMVGDAMYAADDQTFADTTGVTNHIEVGTLAKYVSTTKGWIDIAR